MKIAVIVPVYKVEQYLRRCVDSILAQTHRDFELVLVDDGSPDKCGAICDEYAAVDSRIKVLHQPNQGVSAARNAGIDWVLQNGHAEYITFVDSDDWIEPECFAEFNRGVSLGADCVCVGHADVSNDGIKYCQYMDSGWHVVSPAEYMASDDYFLRVTTWGKLFKLEYFSGIRFPVEMTMGEDAYVTYQLLFRSGSVAMREGAYYNYFKGSVSISRSEWNMRKLDALATYDSARVFFSERGYTELADWALRMKCTTLALNIAPLSERNPGLAEDFRRQIEEARKHGKLPFWKSRMLYKCLGVRFYSLRWFMAMLLDFITRGRRSWLVRESWPIICVCFQRRMRRIRQ